jgi:Ca2+-binding RTX toxin-like protein
MRRPRAVLGIITLAAILAAARPVQADLVGLGFFNPGLGPLVGTAFDPATDSVWVYGDFDADLRRYSRTGTFLSSIPRPGEAANDADLTVAPVAFTLGTTPVPAGTLVFINGETGTAEIYAVDKDTGAVLATLSTAFGVNHVIGGSYHPGRGTFFLATDGLDAMPNTIAEIDPVTGAVLNTFGTGSADYTIDFGDLEVDPTTGHLMLVSSSELRLRILTPTGAFVEDLALPPDVFLFSGFALDVARGEAWASTGTGGVFRLRVFSIQLSPSHAENVVGEAHTVTATLPGSAAGVVVGFEILAGPNAGAVSTPGTGDCAPSSDCTTDARGAVSWTYASNGVPGTDTIVACAVDGAGVERCSPAVTKSWVVPTTPVQPGVPVCNGLVATIHVKDGLVVGGPDHGKRYGRELNGTPGDDVIVGTDGPDLIKAYAGNDTICGLGGDDVIEGSTGDDWIDGGPGNNLLKGQEGDDTILGGDGDDVIEGGPGHDWIDGGPGNNLLKGQEGDDTILGGDGDDIIDGGPGADVIDGGAGFNRIQ